jgi:hypothetical protein
MGFPSKVKYYFRRPAYFYTSLIPPGNSYTYAVPKLKTALKQHRLHTLHSDQFTTRVTCQDLLNLPGTVRGAFRTGCTL